MFENLIILFEVVDEYYWEGEYNEVFIVYFCVVILVEESVDFLVWIDVVCKVGFLL